MRINNYRMAQYMSKKIYKKPLITAFMIYYI